MNVLFNNLEKARLFVFYSITIIHCSISSEGITHSGLLGGAGVVLERMSIEQDVNAFLAIRYVSRRRPEFFMKLVCKFLTEMNISYLTKVKFVCHLLVTNMLLK